MTDIFIKNGGWIHPGVHYWKGNLWAWEDISKDDIIVTAPNITQIFADEPNQVTEKIYYELEDPQSYWSQCSVTSELDIWVSIFGLSDLESKPNRELAKKASYIRTSRSWTIPAREPGGKTSTVVVPVIDRVNHKPAVLSNCYVILPSVEGGDVLLRAKKDIRCGTPLSITYYINEDVVTKAKQYDFFDSSHGHHAIKNKMTLGNIKNQDTVDFVTKYYTPKISKTESGTQLTINLTVMDENGEVPLQTKLLFTALAGGKAWEPSYLAVIKMILGEKDPHRYSGSVKLAHKWRSTCIRSLIHKFSKRVHMIQEITKKQEDEKKQDDEKKP